MSSQSSFPLSPLSITPTEWPTFPTYNKNPHMNSIRRAFGGLRRPAATTYNVSPAIVESCGNINEYLATCNDLQYLHCSDGLKQRAPMGRELSQRLLEIIKTSNDPIEALDAVDTMSNVMCLTLDPAEATRRTHPDRHYREAASVAFDELYQYMSELNTSTDMYDVLVALIEPGVWEKLTPEQQTTTLVMKKDMDSNGIHLPEAERQKIVELTTRQSQLSHDLLRVEDEVDQRHVLDSLLRTRRELAVLSGFDSYADWAMQQSLAQTPDRAWGFLNELSQRLGPVAAKESKKLEAIAKDLLFRSGGQIPLATVDVTSRQVFSMQQYGTQLNQLRDYLSVANIWRGLTYICKELFGIRLEPRTDMHDFERYHPSVQRYDVYDDVSNSLLGVIYADPLGRPEKMDSAGHFTVQLGCQHHEKVIDKLGVQTTKQLPIVIFSCSAQGSGGAGDWEKVLFTSQEMVTVFHEFGHCLHSVFGQTKYQNVAGTRASLDYVETFSQLFEYFAQDYRVLREFARHHETGEAVPEHLVHALKESNSSLAALEKLDQVVLATIDLAVHGPHPLRFRDINGTEVFCDQLTHLHPALRRTHLPFGREVEPALCFSMSHLSNYPAGYYSYAYSKVCISLFISPKKK